MVEGERTCPSCGRSFGADVLFCPTDGIPLSLRASGPSSGGGLDPYLGLKLLGQIEIKKLAGAGSMARVYRAFQHGVEREVAVKILHRELSSNPELVDRFHREARVASKVAHPNVVQVLLTAQLPEDNPQVGGELALVMEYLDGMSLQSALQASGGALALPRALHIVLQICDAVGEAHELGVVHRDLKPENVMLVRRGNDPDFVKVLDFGLARLNTRDASYATRAGAIFGSPRYISPEGAQGLPVEAPADVYAIATILYQCLAGRTPFEADSAVGFLLAHANEIPPRLNSLERASYIPGPFVELLVRGLAKRPEERPADARQLASEILEAAQRSGLKTESLLGHFNMSRGGLTSLARTHEMNLGVARLELGNPLSTGTLVGSDSPESSVEKSLEKPQKSIAVRPPTLPPTASSPAKDAALRPPTLPPELAEPSAADLLAVVSSSGVAPTLFDEPIPAPSASRDREPPLSQPEIPSPEEPSSSLSSSSALTPVPSPTLVHSSLLGAAPPSLLPVVPEEPLHDSPQRSVPRSPWMTMALVAACFGLGAILAFFGANRMGVLKSGPANTPADLLLTQAAEAASRQEWDRPPGQSVKDLLSRGHSEFPADPRFAIALRRASVDVTMNAVKERSAGNNDAAIKLAQLALQLDAENTVAAGISQELQALKTSPIASVSSPIPPKVVSKKVQAGTTAPQPQPPTTKTSTSADKGDKGDKNNKGDKGDKGEKGWL